jgi:hypothetical protein
VQQVSAATEPGAHCADRPGKPGSSLVMRLAIEIAEDQWLTILGWQTVNFFVQHGFQVFAFTIPKVPRRA